MIAVRYKAGAHVVNGEKLALFGRLDRDEVHGRSLHGLGDGLSIAEVVLVSLEETLNVLGWDQANVMPQLLDLARDVIRARAGLEAEKAGRQIHKPADQLVARYLDAHHDCLMLPRPGQR